MPFIGVRLKLKKACIDTIFHQYSAIISVRELVGLFLLQKYGFVNSTIKYLHRFDGKALLTSQNGENAQINTTSKLIVR